MVVVTARCRVPPLRSRISRGAGRGARKYLRRTRDFAGDAVSLVVGSGEAGRFAHEWLKDRHGHRFVGDCAHRENASC